MSDFWTHSRTALPAQKKPQGLRALYWIRNLRSRAVFRALRQHVSGSVLDVGGRDFFLTAKKKGIRFTHWTTLEPSKDAASPVQDSAHSFVIGDGCDMRQFSDESFDTVVNLQVLEHVFEPIRMVQEIGRVLRRGGHAIFLIPQTGTLHLAPHHYYNFTRYWAEEAMKRAGLRIVELRPLGGRFSSTASHMVFFFLQAFRYPSMSVPGKRPTLFYALLPFMLLFALLSIPICLLLSLGDPPEEPNNLLVVVTK